MHTKNKNIVILYSIIIASLIATLTSCRNGSNVEPQIEDNESATVYVPEFSKQEYEIDSSLDFLVDMFVAGDTTYCISREHTFNSGTSFSTHLCVIVYFARVASLIASFL